MEILKSKNAGYAKVNIGDIPAIVVTPKEVLDKYPTIIWYHGWSSDKENQVFRANIFASYGYQVIIPDARGHGERGTLDYEGEGVIEVELPKIVLQNLKEFTEVYDYIVNNLNADENRIAVSGHSMGGITAGGMIAMKPEVKLAALFNGSCNWEWLIHLRTEGSEERFDKNYDLYTEMLEKNPMSNISNFVNKPMISANGEGDGSIDPKSQEEFYNKAIEEYDDKDALVFTTFEDTNHVTTTNMMEEVVRFIQKYL